MRFIFLSACVLFSATLTNAEARGGQSYLSFSEDVITTGAIYPKEIEAALSRLDQKAQKSCNSLAPTEMYQIVRAVRSGRFQHEFVKRLTETQFVYRVTQQYNCL